MSEQSKARRKATMLAKFGSEEAVKKFMSDIAKKASRPGTGGFHYLAKNDPDRLRAISKIGGANGKRTKKLGE
jgi:hypothetical protein